MHLLWALRQDVGLRRGAFVFLARRQELRTDRRFIFKETTTRALGCLLGLTLRQHPKLVHFSQHFLRVEASRVKGLVESQVLVLRPLESLASSRRCVSYGYLAGEQPGRGDLRSDPH